MEVILSSRQMFLIRNCIDTELEMIKQGHTDLSISVTGDAENPDEALESLRQDLIEIQKLMRFLDSEPSMAHHKGPDFIRADNIEEIYVDGDLGTQTGSGTKDDPYGLLQDAWNKVFELQLAGKGGRILIKDNGPHADLQII